MPAQGGNERAVGERLEAEKHHLPRLGKGGQVCLLQVLVHYMEVKGIKPAAAVAARPHVLKIRHEREAQIPGKVLIRGDGIPGLRAGIDPVEKLPLGSRVISGFLVAFRPVRILDGDPAGGVCLFCRGNYILPADLLHQAEAVSLPASVRDSVGGVVRVPPGPAGIAGAVGKKEVIDDELIEQLSGIFAGLPQDGQHFWIVIAEGIEQALLRLIAFRGGDGGGHAAGHLDPVLFKQAAAEGNLFLRSHGSAAEGFQVYLVRAHVFFEKADIVFQFFGGGTGCALGHKIVNELKIPVIAH